MKGDIKNWTGSIITGLVLAIMKWGLSEFWRNESMRQHIGSFLITFSPLFIGFLGFVLYWFIIFSKKIYKKYINYQQDQKAITDKVNIYQNAVISLSNQIININNRLDEIEASLRIKSELDSVKKNSL